MMEMEEVSLEGGKRNLPDGWKWVKLGDVCEIIMGQSPVGSSYNSNRQGEPLLNGPTEFGLVHPTPIQWTNRPTRFAEPGDILFCVRGATTGRKNIADQRYCIGRGLAAIRGKLKQADNSFLYFLLDAVTVEILRETAGSTFPNLQREKLENFKIPLPPLDEQKRIAAILNEQMEAVEKARESAIAQLEAAKELTSAYLRSVFQKLELQQCQKRKLGDVCELIGGMQPPKSEFINSPQIGYVRLVQIQDFRRSDMAVYIPENEAKRRFDESDVMIGRYGPPVFQILRGLSGSYNVALMKADPKPDLLKDYLYYLLQEPKIQKAVTEQSQRTAGQSGVQKEFVENFLVFVPSLSEQKEIASKLSSKITYVENLQKTLEQQLEAINKLPAAFLRQAFNGEL